MGTTINTIWNDIFIASKYIELGVQLIHVVILYAQIK